MVVDPAKATRAPAFDHAKLAATLSSLAGATYEGGKLPFQTIELSPDGSFVTFTAGGKGYQCAVDGSKCSPAAAGAGGGGRGGRGGGGRGAGRPAEASSPDK